MARKTRSTSNTNREGKSGERCASHSIASERSERASAATRSSSVTCGGKSLRVRPTKDVRMMDRGSSSANAARARPSTRLTPGWPQVVRSGCPRSLRAAGVAPQEEGSGFPSTSRSHSTKPRSPNSSLRPFLDEFQLPPSLLLAPILLRRPGTRRHAIPLQTPVRRGTAKMVGTLSDRFRRLEHLRRMDSVGASESSVCGATAGPRPPISEAFAPVTRSSARRRSLRRDGDAWRGPSSCTSRSPAGCE